LLGHDVAEPVAAVASFIVLAAVLLFAYLVFRPAMPQAAELTLRRTPGEGLINMDPDATKQ
jgi:hypothetical protein